MLIVRLSVLRKTNISPEYRVFMCICVFVDYCFSHYFALNCRLQIENINPDCTESDDDHLTLVFRSLSFLSASQILFASNCSSFVDEATLLCSILCSMFAGLS